MTDISGGSSNLNTTWTQNTQGSAFLKTGKKNEASVEKKGDEFNPEADSLSKTDPKNASQATQAKNNYSAYPSAPTLPKPELSKETIVQNQGENLLPNEGDEGYAKLLTAFTSKDGTSPQQNLARFINNNPPGTPLYKAAVGLLTKPVTSQEFKEEFKNLGDLKQNIDNTPPLKESLESINKTIDEAPIPDKSKTDESGKKEETGKPEKSEEKKGAEEKGEVGKDGKVKEGEGETGVEESKVKEGSEGEVKGELKSAPKEGKESAKLTGSSGEQQNVEEGSTKEGLEQTAEKNTKGETTTAKPSSDSAQAQVAGAHAQAASTPEKKTTDEKGKTEGKEGSSSGVSETGLNSGQRVTAKKDSDGDSDSDENTTPAAVTDASKTGKKEGVAATEEVVGNSNVEGADDVDATGVDGVLIDALTDGIDQSKLPQSQAMLKEVNNWMESAQALLAGLPNSADKDSMMGFLKKISDATMEFSTMMYQMQLIDTDATKVANKASLEATLDGIEKQRSMMHKQIKAAKKKHKKAKMGVFSKIMQSIEIAILICIVAVAILAPGCGQVIAAILIMQITSQIQQMSNSKADTPWEAAGKATDSMCKSVGKAFGMSKDDIDKLRTAVKVVIATIVISALLVSGSFLLAGTSSITDVLVETGLVKNKEALGPMGMVISITGAILSMIVMTAIGIGLAIFTGGGSLVAAIAGDIAIISAEAAIITADVVMNVLSLMLTVLSTVNSIMTSTNQIILAQMQMALDKAMGKNAQAQAILEGFKEAMKQLIKSLQEDVANLSKAIGTVQEQNNHKWAALSKSMDGLLAANLQG